MDASLYDSRPAFLTSLQVIEVPQTHHQKLQFPDGRSMSVPAGATLCKAWKHPSEIVVD
jgi:hypothetical protein